MKLNVVRVFGRNKCFVYNELLNTEKYEKFDTGNVECNDVNCGNANETEYVTIADVELQFKETNPWPLTLLKL